MKKLRIALAGAGGYGQTYFNVFDNYLTKVNCELVGVIDPFVERAVDWPRIQVDGTPVYKTLDEFYAADTADIMIISTPVQFHREMVIRAIDAGSDVLCEKPLVPLARDAKALGEYAASHGRRLAVGFQWSAAPAILKLKKDILDGTLGKPLSLRTYISWQRTDAYYASGWKGKMRDNRGELLMDSVITNATAHYLHNIFFVLGEKEDESAMPDIIRATSYRAKDIETVDSSVIAGKFKNGAEFTFVATHSGDKNINPLFRYEFENAIVDFDADKMCITATFADGTTKKYGDPNSAEGTGSKLLRLIDAIRTGAPLPCTASTVMPYEIVTNAVFAQVPINTLTEGVYRCEDEPATYIHGFSDELMKCYDCGKTPAELGFSWAAKDVEIRPNEIDIEEILK